MTTATTQRITITLPKPLIDQLDAVISTRERSQFIARAIQEQLAIIVQAEAVDKAAGAWADEDYPALMDDKAINDWLTQLRSGWQRPIG